MKHEGMVHALEEIRRLLTPGGSLIDIHPVLEAPLVEVHLRGRILLAEPSPGYSGEDYQQAEDALRQVVQGCLFVVEDSGEFDFLVYGSSVAELRDFMAEANAYDDRPTDEAVAAQETELAGRIEESMQSAGTGAEVAYHERGRIARLRPMRSGSGR